MSVAPEVLQTPIGFNEIYANAKSLRGWLSSKSDDMEQARKLTPEVAAQLVSAGMFRINMPRAWDGPA